MTGPGIVANSIADQANAISNQVHNAAKNANMRDKIMKEGRYCVLCKENCKYGLSAGCYFIRPSQCFLLLRNRNRKWSGTLSLPAKASRSTAAIFHSNKKTKYYRVETSKRT